jgi:hypothetical protein
MALSRYHPPVAGFATGTGIATDRGEVAVENLVESDRILTMDQGYRKLLWSDPAMPLRAKGHPSPVRVATGSLGPDLPLRDVVLGRGHRVLLTGPPVTLYTGEHEAFAVVDDLSVTDAQGGDQTLPGVPLHQLLLRDHELILANGIWCESVFGDSFWFDTLPAGLRQTLRGRLETPHDQTARLCLARHETVAILGHSPKADDLAA